MKGSNAAGYARQTETLPLKLCSLLAVSMLLGAMTTVALGQECANCALPDGSSVPASASEWSFKKEVNEVNVVFIAAHHGKFISGLKPDDIVVRDDSKAPEAVLRFRGEADLPLRVALLVDTSDSLTERFRFEQAAASSFLRHSLNQSSDLGFVMGFSDDPRLMQDFTADPELLAKGVERLKIGGGTALYDAVADSCRRLVEHPEPDMTARVLVILSDGQSNAGTLHLDDAIDAAARSEVAIYTISTHYPVMPTDMDDPSAVEGNKNLRKLAEQTGGRALYPANPKEIGQAFEKITEELRSRYAVSYRPADFSNDGHYRKITIEARQEGKKLDVRARKGYFARPAPSATPASNPDSVVAAVR